MLRKLFYLLLGVALGVLLTAVMALVAPAFLTPAGVLAVVILAGLLAAGLGLIFLPFRWLDQ